MWPVDCPNDYKVKGDWGITWIELAVSFILYTGYYLPIKVGGTGYHTEYVEYLDDAAKLLPAKKRAAAAQSMSFEKLAQTVQNVAGIKIWPSFSSRQALSMQHLGFKGHLSGVPCRPGLPNAAATMKAVREIITVQGDVTRHCFSAPCQLEYHPAITFEPVLELPMSQRLNRYVQLTR